MKNDEIIKIRIKYIKANTKKHKFEKKLNNTHQTCCKRTLGGKLCSGALCAALADAAGLADA